MVQAVAIQEIKSNNKVVGYKLKDENGLIMDVKTSAIIDAMNKKLINIHNLKVLNNNELQLIKDETNDTKNKVYTHDTNEVISKSKTPQQPESVGVDSDVTGGSVLINESDPKIKRMHTLIATLNEATKVYEQGKDEIISNKEWDAMYDELERLEAETGTILANSPTQNVGYEVVSNLPKEKHETRMLSLAKTKSREDLAAFLGSKEGVLSWKLDGLTVVLTYNNGDLIKGVTRGNGEIGEVVTPNVKQFKNVPRHIAFPGKLVLRGEAVIRYSTFEKINATIVSEDDKYKNPRNLCSGSVRQLDSKITAQRNVEWLCFEVVECQGKTLSNNVDEQLKFIKLLGFDAVESNVVTASTVEAVVDQFEVMVSKGYDIPTDGLVLTFRDKAYGESLGTTSKTPRHSKAFKWKDETVISKIEDIEWSCSRTGLINPVAIFKPVDIEGSTVSRASVHNVSIFGELELGYGDRVEVYKANMIIPQISENLDRTATCEVPRECPCCGEETVIHEEAASGVLTLWCENPDCPAKGNRLLKHFVSRDAMNIDGISGATLEKLVDEGLITDFASIYHLYEHGYEISHLEGFGDKSFNNMVDAIEKSRDVKPANLIYALGIPNIGISTAKLICKTFNNDIKKVVTARYHDLLDIDGIGETIAYSFTSYFANKENADNFIALYKELRVIEEAVSTKTSMQGVTICVTGDVYIFSNRRVIKELVEDLGGKLTGSVSRSTNYLVTNDTTSGSRKNKAAQEYGIPILTEKEFIDKFNLSEYI